MSAKRETRAGSRRLEKLRSRRGRRRWLQPPRTLRPTRAGWVFFAFTLGVGLAALNTGNNLLYMIHALLLSFLVLSGVMSESALRGIRVRRRLPAELVAERLGQIALEVQNDQARIPSFAIVVEDFAANDDDEQFLMGRVFALRIAPRARETRSYGFAAEARGVLRLAGVRVATRFPFGLFSKALWIDLPEDALVYPALDPVDVRAAPAGEPRHAEASGASGGTAAECAGLREYAPGDPFRRIHWRASLRRNQLLVREPELDRRRDVTLHLATRGAHAGDAFERDVRRAASEIAAYLAVGHRVGLRTDQAVFLPADGARQRAQLLGHLAAIAPDAAESAA